MAADVFMVSSRDSHLLDLPSFWACEAWRTSGEETVYAHKHRPAVVPNWPLEREQSQCTIAGAWLRSSARGKQGPGGMQGHKCSVRLLCLR